jgi:hypothetical protein
MTSLTQQQEKARAEFLKEAKGLIYEYGTACVNAIDHESRVKEGVAYFKLESFLLNTIASTRLSTIEEAEAGMPKEREDPGDFGGTDDKLIREQWWGFTTCRKAYLAHLEVMRNQTT